MTFNRATILVTGPNRAGRAFLSDNLNADGHEVLSAPTVATAWQLLCGSVVDLIVVDLSDFTQLDRGGLELVARVRQSSRWGVRVDPTIPIVVLTPRVGEVERLRIFDHGGDDLVQHPYSYPELRARIGALLRRSRGNWGPVRIRVGPLEVDTISHQAWLDARPVELAGKEFALLAMLATDPSRVFSRNELLQRVWGFTGEARTRTVDVHASRLRRKLAHPRERFVVNAWGEGYKLVSAVSDQERELPGAVTVPGFTAPAGLSLVDRQRAA